MSDIAAAARKVQSECLCTRARQTSRVLTRIYDEMLRPVGLQLTQFTVLVGAARFGDAGAPIGKLAERLFMDRTTLTRNIGPLVDAGLLRVGRSPGDARVKVVLLTKKGERAIAAGMPLWEKAQATVRSRLGDGRAANLAAELDSVSATLAG